MIVTNLVTLAYNFKDLMIYQSFFQVFIWLEQYAMLEAIQINLRKKQVMAIYQTLTEYLLIFMVDMIGN